MIVYNSPSGRKLNRKQFLTSFEKKVRKTIRTNRLIDKKEKILIALSGGKDSATTAFRRRPLSRAGGAVAAGSPCHTRARSAGTAGCPARRRR